MSPELIAALSQYRNDPNDTTLEAVIPHMIQEYGLRQDKKNPLKYYEQMTLFFSEIADCLKPQTSSSDAESSSFSDGEDSQTSPVDTMPSSSSFLPMKSSGFFAASSISPSSVVAQEIIAFQASTLWIEFWSQLGIELFKQISDFRNRSTSTPEKGLLIAIVHQQLFGADFSTAFEAYPATWDLWKQHIQDKFVALSRALTDSPIQKAFWERLYKVEAANVTDQGDKRGAKIIYQLVFDFIVSFKVLAIDMATRYLRPIEVITTVKNAVPIYRTNAGDTVDGITDDMAALIVLWQTLATSHPTLLPVLSEATQAAVAQYHKDVVVESVWLGPRSSKSALFQASASGERHPLLSKRGSIQAALETDEAKADCCACPIF